MSAANVQQRTPSDSGSDFEVSLQGKRAYFTGIGGNPQLVARTGRERFFQPKGTTKRQSRQVGPHPITEAYNQGAREKIRQVFKDQDVPQALINLLRIGYSKTVLENPLVVLITVGAGSIQYDKAKNVVDSIHEVLKG